MVSSATAQEYAFSGLSWHKCFCCQTAGTVEKTHEVDAKKQEGGKKEGERAERVNGFSCRGRREVCSN